MVQHSLKDFARFSFEKNEEIQLISANIIYRFDAIFLFHHHLIS